MSPNRLYRGGPILMRSDRPQAVQTSARMLLGKLWSRRAEFFPSRTTIDAFLIAAPELLVREILDINLEYRAVISNDSTMQIAGFLDRDARLIVITNGF